MRALTPTEFNALGIDLTDTPELRPGTDFHGGQLYITVPVPGFKTKKIGRGKDAKEVQKRVVETWIIRSDRGLVKYDPEILADHGFRGFDKTMPPDEDRWPINGEFGWRDYAIGKCPEIAAPAMYSEIRSIFERHLEFSTEAYHDIASLYVIGSYLFRIWNAYPFLHLNGTRQSGKSQTLRVMQALALNGVMGSSMSQAVLLRIAAGRPGLICVDEAEQLNGEKGEDIRLLLNGGYQQSGKALRAEKDANDNWMPAEFPTYGPKVLASINPLEPTIQSRCIVLATAPAIRRIPHFRGDDPQWAKVRSRLYVFALQHAARINALNLNWEAELHEQRAPDLISRQWEITQPLIVLANYCGGDALADNLIAFFKQYFIEQQRALDEVDRTRTVLKALPRVIRTKTPMQAPFAYSLKDIHDVVVSFIEEDSRDKVTTRTVSRQLVALGFRERITLTGGTAVPLDPEEVRAQFRKRRVEAFPEDAAWLDADFIEPVRPAPQKQNEFDWLNDYIEANSG